MGDGSTLAPTCLNADWSDARLAIALGRRKWTQNKRGRKSETGGTWKMEKSPGQRADQRTVSVTYRAEIHAQCEGEEAVPLDRSAKGSSIRELADDLVAQTSELEAEAHDKLVRAEAERDKAEQTVNQAELSGRRRRSWE
jgi:molybdopterin converting factor small subunit